MATTVHRNSAVPQNADKNTIVPQVPAEVIRKETNNNSGKIKICGGDSQQSVESLSLAQRLKVSSCKDLPSFREHLSSVPVTTGTSTTLTNHSANGREGNFGLSTAKSDLQSVHSDSGKMSAHDQVFAFQRTLSAASSQSDIPSLSEDSQSQSSYHGSSQSEAVETEFVLHPGMFEIILCVDNCELYGG